MSEAILDDEYDAKLLAMLELIWGAGFLSPGGPAAVDEIVAGLDLAGKRVVDIGSGLGGVDMHLARKHGARVIGMEIAAPLVALAKARVAAAGLCRTGSICATARPVPWRSTTPPWTWCSAKTA